MEHALLLDLEETYLIDLLSTHPFVDVLVVCPNPTQIKF